MDFKTYISNKLNEDIERKDIDDKINAIKEILGVDSNDMSYDDQIGELIFVVGEEYNTDIPLLYDGKDSNGKVVLVITDSIDNVDFILRHAQVFPKDNSWIDYDIESQEYEIFYNVFNKLHDNPTRVKTPASIKNWNGSKGTITTNGVVE